MKNLKDVRHIPRALQKVMIEFGMTLNDIDNMDYDQFKSFCAQLEEKQLRSLDWIVTNDIWKVHTFTVLNK